MDKASLKERLKHEVRSYLLTVCYLTCVFGAFTWYRRLLLASYDIVYTHYLVAFIEALVLGKVIMIGELLRLGKGLENRPLILPTLYRAVVFSLFVALFKFVEHGLRGVFKGVGFFKGMGSVFEDGLALLLANSLVVFVAMVPFFAFREISRVMGGATIARLFFKWRPAAGSHLE